MANSTYKILNINISSDKYSFTIVEKEDIDKIRIFWPISVNTCSNITTKDNNCTIDLDIEDRPVSYHPIYEEYLINSSLLNPLSKNVKIDVPVYSVKKLNIKDENGSVTLENINCSQVKIACVRGNVNISNCHIENGTIECYKSNITLKNNDGNNLDVHTIVGNISIEDNIPSNLILTTDVGNISLYSDICLLSDTTISICTKQIDNQITAFKKEKKQLKLTAPHGKIDTNIF